MGVRFQCPNGHKLHVKTELAGRRGICPECGAKFVVPSFSGGRVPEDGTSPPASVGVSTPAPAESRAEAPVGAPVARPSASGAGAASSIVIKTQTPAPAVQAVAPNTPQAIEPPKPQAMAQPVAQPIASPPSAQPATDAAGAAASEPAAWYVRPASGGQFGPATAEVFQQWIADGRVAADSWVWRTGWADWKAGSEALALVADRPPLDPAAAMAAALDERAGVMPAVSTSTGAAAAAVEAHTAEQRRLEIKRRKQRMRMISGLLALVALAMLLALVAVLAR